MFINVPDDVIAKFLKDIHQEAQSYISEGKVADYIPELAKVPISKMGIAVCMADGRIFSSGDAEEAFSIQSISKLFSLALALEHIGPDIWKRVGREASGMSFNSLILLEQENGIPRNPFINAGAIVIVDALSRRFSTYDLQFKNVMRRLCQNEKLNYNDAVYMSESEHGDLNRAIAYFLRAKGNLYSNPQQVIDYYFRQCSLEASCVELALASKFLIGPHMVPPNGPLQKDFRQPLRALMLTAGLYDKSGTFAYEVGLPAKSGVGGGIIAVCPGHYSICAWSPALDERGNSVAGMRAIELFARYYSEASQTE